jgi:uncharacterized protein YcbX
MSTFQSFLQHYLDYLTSPGGVIACGLVFLWLYILRAEAGAKSSHRSTLIIPGCARFGLRGRSNLDDQYQLEGQSATEDGLARVKALFVYPIKSCKGIELPLCQTTATGLIFDRLFCFAQLVSTEQENDPSDERVVNEKWNHQWRFITQREFPKLALIETELWVPLPHDDGDRPRTGSPMGGDWAADGGCLLVRFPYKEDRWMGTRTETVTLRLPLSPTIERARAKKYSHERLTIWRDNPVSINVTTEIEQTDLAKLQYFLGVRNPLALFRPDAANLRSITRSLPKDRDDAFHVGFADAFPIHLLNIPSARAVDECLPADAELKGRLDARRFRANIYLSGTPAFAEDRWKRLCIGKTARVHDDAEPAQFHAACRTARCSVPNVDPATGIKDRCVPRDRIATATQY